MAEDRRNIGLEILEGIRQLKRGEHGRIIDPTTTRPTQVREESPQYGRNS